ncbi:saposin-C-like [Centroberyx affinis]|uniref:saposin-C-like n=1 Tax=Centroberyx affinis TaxID=166261 RepID=UPI003A5BA540
MKTMKPAIGIALLLLCALVVESWHSLEDRPEDHEDFPSMWKDYMERADHLTEEYEAFPGFCKACKVIISKVQKKLGGATAKDEISKLLDSACNRVGKLIKGICKKILNKYKDKLIDALANKMSAKDACVKLTLCKKYTPAGL